MSWWPLPDSEEDVTGDAPADWVSAALEPVVAQRKPRLEELTAALEQVLRAHPEQLGDPGRLKGGQVVPRSGGGQAPAPLVKAVEAALASLHSEYQRVHGRAPRVAEVLYTFTFVLDGEPAMWVQEPPPEGIALRLVPVR
jgi:hypothetical protein